MASTKWTAAELADQSGGPSSSPGPPAASAWSPPANWPAPVHASSSRYATPRRASAPPLAFPAAPRCGRWTWPASCSPLELQRRLTEAGNRVRAVTAHPGIARTSLGDQADRVSRAVYRYLGWLFNDAEHGALPTLYAATQDVPGGSYIGPDGLGHLRGYPEIQQPSKRAQDPQMARQLWDLSARLTGAGQAAQADQHMTGPHS